jgi:hypothetical protein
MGFIGVQRTRLLQCLSLPYFKYLSFIQLKELV